MANGSEPQSTPQQSAPRKYVAIAGNIGAGKSSLSRVLADYYQWDVFYESVEDNPYLEDFYKDMQRWSFDLQVYFLSSRFKHQRLIQESDRSIVQDRSIYEDAEIFAHNLYLMGLMSERDYQNYVSLFSIMTSYLKPPDLLIFLKASVPTLVSHIQSRGRAFETSIRIDYLERLNELYDAWFARYDLGPKLQIDVDQYDFVNNPDDRMNIIGRIESRLFGLFPD